MSDQWVSVEEASKRLGCSVSTVRRRIEAGELEAEREVIGGSRERFRVRLPDASGEASAPEPTGEPPDASETLQDAPAAITGLLELVRELRQQGTADALRISGLHGQIADLSRRLGAAEASAAMLERQRARSARWLDEAHAEIARLRRRRWWQVWR